MPASVSIIDTVSIPREPIGGLPGRASGVGLGGGTGKWCYFSVDPSCVGLLCNSKVVQRLQVQPRLCIPAAVARWPHGALGRNARPLANNVVNTWRRHTQSVRKCVCPQTCRTHEALTQYLIRVNRTAKCASASPLPGMWSFTAKNYTSGFVQRDPERAAGQFEKYCTLGKKNPQSEPVTGVITR
jgi:hypothetical protein